jgi:hypothetical protein
MGLIDQLKKDVASITSNTNDFGVMVNFEFGEFTCEVSCLQTAHQNGIDADGMRVNSRISSVAVSEQNLVALEYPTRNESNEITFRDHILTIDGNKYIVTEFYPDETAGLIVLFLGTYYD